jgi:hypothetical protein
VTTERSRPVHLSEKLCRHAVSLGVTDTIEALRVDKICRLSGTPRREFNGCNRTILENPLPVVQVPSVSVQLNHVVMGFSSVIVTLLHHE